jgi:drug/metabolite transporter (DMT)-like permease
VLAVVLALGSAGVYGAADFLGGLLARRISATTVTLLGQVAGVLVLGLALPFVGGVVRPADLAWGATSGMAGGVGVLLLYRALAMGTMSVVAPITAVCAAGLPVVVGLALGERPDPLALVGVALALLAIGLVSREGGEAAGEERADAPPRRASAGAVRLALLAGLAFGLFFVLLERSSEDAGLWPLVAARAGSISLLAVLAVVTRQPFTAPRGLLAGIAVSGTLDMAANVLYLLATREGLLSLVAVLTSLYPASTVLLATVVLRERLRAVQLGGLLCAAVAVVLIAL